MPLQENEIAFSCLFCRTGCEKSISEELNRSNQNVHTFVPSKLRYRRFAGQAIEEEVILFPGYIFFAAPTEYWAFQFLNHKLVYRILCMNEGKWQLAGPDKALVQRLYESKGAIGFSKAYFERDRIRILDGFLKEHEGEIIRVNKRAQTAQIKVTLEGKDILIWLGYELISSMT